LDLDIGFERVCIGVSFAKFQYCPVSKITEKAVRKSVFLTTALYFECRINKNALLQTVCFGDFAHWVRAVLLKINDNNNE